MNILLLTDIPPCTNYTAGLVLYQLCHFLEKGTIVCYAVVNSQINAKVSSDLDWIPTEYCRKPNERAFRVIPGKLGSISAFLAEFYTSKTQVEKLSRNISLFGKTHGVDRLWCVLQGQTMIRLAIPVSRQLGVPLYSQIWDPPNWWLRVNRIDRISAYFILKTFENVLKSSHRCATASWAMASKYEQDYGVQTMPIISSIDPSISYKPLKDSIIKNEFIIGYAGQIYATEEWEALIAACYKMNWIFDNKTLKVRVIGSSFNQISNHPVHIEFLGWRSQKETIRILNDCDLLYCPYWFDETFETEAQLSFPSKLSTYLASGKPILFHGPRYSSPAKFLEEHQAAYCCYSLKADDVILAIQEINSNQGFYFIRTMNGYKSYIKYLSANVMRNNFVSFIST